MKPDTCTTLSDPRGVTPAAPPELPIAALLPRMALVADYRASLLRLQGAWDLLALLGPMSGIGSEISQTRDDFHRLSDTLVSSLARQLLQQRLQSLLGRAQVTIDILVRNLFERTADVGFLATDAPLRDYLQAVGDGSADSAQRDGLRARFGDYVRKYSVYDDVIIVAGDGRVLARLDTGIDIECSRDPLIVAALRPGVPYVESFGASDLLGGRRGLVYASAIGDALGRPAGVLCLSFRFEDEMRGICSHLLGGADDRAGDGTVLALIDADGVVLVSSDPWQLPPGAPLPAASGDGRVLRFAGREYLAVAARSTGYQGYAGPGWQAVALVPVDLAFRGVEQRASGGEPAPAGSARAAGDAADAGSLAALADGIDTKDIFDAELRAIPSRARQIQRELARSVWNGTLVPARDSAAASPASSAFSTTFLHEVSRTGTQIRSVFDSATSQLQAGALTAVLDHARFQASLAIDIMDRNLYERANDCRWWALTPALREALAAPDAATLAKAVRVLEHINGLYTVYTLLVLFDAAGRIVAVSDPARGDLAGAYVDPALARETLALRDPELYHVVPHAASALYGGLPTCVYAAALRRPVAETLTSEGRGMAAAATPIGGVAIVFDGVPQFEAMLRDALPRDVDGRPLAGAIGLFVSRAGSVVASTDSRFPALAAVPLDAALLDLRRGAAERHVVEIDGMHYAAGISQGGGYREYRAGREQAPDDVAAVVLLPLGRTLTSARPAPAAASFTPRPPRARDVAAGRPVQLASFTLAADWFALAADEVEKVLGAASLMALPNAPGHVAGLLQHRGQIVPVLDPGVLLGVGQAPADGPLLLCRAPQGQPVALRVDTLGAVFEVDDGQLVPWHSAAAGRKLRLLSGESGSRPGMLSVLSIDSLWPAGGSSEAMAELAEFAKHTTASGSTTAELEAAAPVAG